MKKVMLFFCFCLFANCQKNLYIQNDHPAIMVGSWLTMGNADSHPDTMLELSQSGVYTYTIFSKIDSVTNDTTYKETGS